MTETPIAVKSRFAALTNSGKPMSASLKAGIAVGFLARFGSSASGLLLGLYISQVVTRANNGQDIAGTIAQLTIAFFAVELLLAPVFGGLSDRIGRKPFLLAGPLIAAAAVQIHPLTTIVLVIAFGRILEGLATSSSTPGTLGFLSDVTGGDPALRGRVMGLYELASLVGLVAGVGLGGPLWDLFGANGLRLVSLIHLLAAFIVIMFIRESKPQLADAEAAPVGDADMAALVAALPDNQQIAAASGWRARLAEYGSLLRIKTLWSFAPAWIAINGVVGLWLNQAAPLLSRADRDPDQFLQGGRSGSEVGLTFVLIGVTFMVGIFIWSLFYARLRKTNMMLVSIAGCFAVCAILFAINSRLLGEGVGVILLLLPLLAALFVMSGFTPVALAYLADITEGQVRDRGAVMGLYSVFLAIGQVIGTALGAPFINALGFNGMLLATVLLTGVALVAVVRLRVISGD